MRQLKIMFAFSLIAFALQAQIPVGRDTITVLESGKVLKNAWAGGLNSCMFSQMDLDFDTKNDLIVFDRVNNFGYGILRCFLNKGGVGQTKYVYDAWYTGKFPKVEQWVYFYDYNGDGKADIFTSTIGGIKVFRNTSTGGNISFQLLKSILYTNYTPTMSPTMINIYASPVVIPALADQDNDGDMDILNFSSSGFQIEHQKNLSVEKGYGKDSLIFETTDYTWGDIYENNCSLVLNQYMADPNNNNNGTNLNKAEMHSGSCLMCFDRDGDGDQDLLMGDIACNAINYAENGGAPTASHVTDTTKLYPNYPAKASTQVIKITNFPCTYHLDIDNDGKKDLIASPSAINSENYKSVWYYNNAATGNVADFRFVKNNFLQDEMIEVGEGAYPIVFDVDADGLQDLLIGNTGYFTVNTALTALTYYRNVGTLSQPKYSLVTRDYAGVSALAVSNSLYALVPAIGDLDGDGDVDMILADYYGKIAWYENTAGFGNPCNFSIFKNNYFSLGSLSAPYPQIIDVNRDGKNDLLIGTRNGKISYFQNTGSISSPTFALQTNFFGKVYVKRDGIAFSTDGSCAPFMFDAGGSYKLLCGSMSGYIYYYDNIDGNLTGTFNVIDTTLNYINDGLRNAVQYVDLNSDGKRDLIIGNYSGGLSFYSSKNYFIGVQELKSDLNGTLSVFPNPASNYIEIKSNDTEVEKMEITMTDMCGKVILTRSVNANGLSISTENFSRGVYLLKTDAYVDKQKQSSYKKIVLN
jgi:hypothetical protein